MPIRSIDDLRSAVGKDWDSVSDEDLIKSYADSVKLNPIEVARTLGYDPGAGGRESKRTTAAISNYVGNLQGVGEEVSGALGLSGARDYLAEKRRANEFQAGVASARARDMGAIESYKDVNNLSDFGNYAVGLGIQSAPYLGEAALGGIGVRAAMGGTRAALAAAEASGDVAAAARAKRALSLGSDAGVVAATYPSAVGDVLSNQREQTGGKTDIGSAALLAVPYAALNVVGVEGALGKGQLFRNPLNLLDNVSGLKGGLARTAATGTTTAFKEGLQETSQEAINQAGRMAVDPTEQFFNEKSNERFKESFVGGATLGGFIGGVAGGWRRSESFVAGANTGTNDQTGQQSTNDIQQTFQQTSTGTTPLATPIASNLADQMAGSAGRENPLAGRASLIGQTEPQTTAPITPAAPAVNGGTTDIAQAQAAAQQQNQQQTQADFAAQQQQKEAERAVFMAELVGLPNPEGQSWDFFGKPVFGPAIQEAAAANAQLVGSMNGTQARITRAINIANNQTGGKLVNVNFNPLKAADSVRKTLEKVAETAARFQIAHVGSVEEAAQILEQLSQSTKGAQLEQLNAIHQALTGKDTSGYTASQQTKGATNEQQLQTTTGVGTVPVQGGTGEGSSGVAGNVQPGRLQSLISGSQPQGQTGEQIGQPSGEGIRTGTSVTPDISGGQPAPGQVNEEAPATQAATGQAATVATTEAGGQPTTSTAEVDQGIATQAAVDEVEGKLDSIPDLIRNVLKMVFPKARPQTIQLYATFMSQKAGFNAQAQTYEQIAEALNKMFPNEKPLKASTIKDYVNKDLKLDENGIPLFISREREKVMAAVQFQANKLGVDVQTLLTGLTSVLEQEVAQSEETGIVDEIDLINSGLQIQNRTERVGVEGEKTGKSDRTNVTNIVDENNKADTLNQKYLSLVDEMEQALEANDEERIAELQTEIAGVVEKIRKEVKLEQGRTRAQAGKVKAEKGEAGLTGAVTPVGEDVGERATAPEAEETVEPTPAVQTKEEEDAVQEQNADEGNVRQPAKGGETVGKGNAKPAKPARKVRQAKAEEDRPEIKEQRSTLERLLPKQIGGMTLESITPYSGNWTVKYGSENAFGMKSSQNVPIDADMLVGKSDAEISKLLYERMAKNGLKEKAAQTPAEAAEAAWNKVADTMPSAPKFADLTKEQQEDFIDFGPENWTEADVTLELIKLAKAAPAATTPKVEKKPAPVSRAAVTAKTVLDTNKFVYHAVRSDEDLEAIMRDGVAPGTNVSTSHDGQAFAGEGDTILVLPKDEAGAKAKGYQQDSITSTNVFPVAILKDDSLLSTEGNTIENELLNEEEEIRNSLLAFDKTLGITEEQRNQAIAKAEVGNKDVAKQLFGEFYDRIMKLSRRQDSVWDELDRVERLNALPTLESYNQYGLPVFALNIQYNEATDKVKLKVKEKVEAAPATEIVTEKRQTIEDLDASGEQPKFGKGTAPAKPYTAKSLIAELKDFMRVDALGRNVIVVDDVADLEDLRDQAIGWSNDRAFGWTRGGKAILIASRIQEGQGRAKFMHEVGSHLGLDRMLSEKDIVGLASQISKWADLNNNSKESVLARKAIERVGNANVADEDVMSELIAYFVEEAILSGVDPSASSKLTGAFGNWFRTLWAGFKNAVRKLGFKPESLTAQDVVNMAYGAARLEVAGTWHGTAADFRKFNHQYMGTGEGAQAFGWGSYLAQRYGIAEGYRTADIKRKTKAPLNALAYSYGGLNDFQQQQQYFSDGGTPIKLNLTMLHSLRVRSGALYIPTIEVTGSKTPGALSYKAADQIFKKDGSPLFSDQQIAQMLSYVNRTSNNPVGSMMRVDVNMQDNETLNWDEKISNMPQEVQDNLAKIKDSLEAEGLLEGYLDKLNADWEELTGADLYKTILKQAHEADAKIFHDIPGSDRMKADKASSLLLDSLGIKGLKFLDARSRDKGEKQIMFNGKTYSREDLINMRSAKGTPIPLDQITTLRHVLRHGVEETIKEYQAKVDKREKQILDVYRESAERYKVPFNEAEELARAKQQALNSYEAKQIEFLKAADVKVVDNKDITRNLVVFNDANIFRAATNIGGSKEQVKFGISPAATVDETINRLPPFVRTPTRNLVTGLLHQAKNGIYASAITEDVVKMASKYMKSAKDYLDAQYARQATRIEFEQRINKILSDYDKLSDEFKGTGANSVNKFIKDSTVSGKWGYYPGENRVGTELFTVDPDMKLRFDAFDESAQNVIKAVFEHGYDALMLKKKAVEAAIDREFADREKAAMGDTEQLQELAKEKKLLLAREAKIRGIDISSPYAYLGRYGDYVVVAKSAEFKHYEERAKLNDWDVKQAKQWLQDNISNSDHYVVQFAETQAEADTIAEQLHATGNYDIMPEDAGVKEAEESYTGGGDIHLAVGRLRNLLQRQVSDGDMSSANFQSMNKMVGDLYLMTVAESSARKSLLQRKNVAGADDNMMRNLATSGRADAHFLSTLKHNDAITDSMERMRTEAKNQRREAMPLYNELAKRQANSMEYKTPSTLAIALNRMNTIWSLTFSPAYYLQQTLQTAMISVPYLAGRLGYGTAVSQVNRGYKDMAGLVKGLGVNDHIDFSKAPADVRDMLNKLVGMGKIDISMDADERATADEKGILAKVMYKMQGVNNRIEAVNRSVAAIAAYRGYLARYGNNNTEAATQYAAQVVSDTHGSYDGFNTPRLLAGNIGRVVGQFRRFQIIQLSMLARLMNNAFKGTSADEKMVARKALGFITAQMAVVGGAMAVPFFNQIAWMMSKILGDPDEPDDFEFKLRRLIDNKVASDLLLRGVPAALGVDVSDKLGMGRVASILPFSQGDLTSRAGAEKVLVAAMGPSANMAMKFADSFGMVLKGDYYKGLEMALPNGFANVMKAGRFASEGITMRNGDLVLKPEDFSMVDAAFQAVGLPTNTVTNRQFTQNVKAEYDKFYAQRSADIKSSYVKAYRDNDPKGMADAREEFQRMEDSRVANGYKRQPMSDLFKAPMEAMKRERGVIGGVETSKQNRRFVEQASQI